MQGTSTSSRQIKSLKVKLSSLKNQFSSSIIGNNDTEKTIIFITLGWKTNRAKVFVGVGNYFKTSWKNAQDKALKYVMNHDSSPNYVKADIVTNQKQLSISKFIRYINKTKKNYVRYGISFDSEFNLAFLEQEINANAIIKHDQNFQKAYLDEANVNNYVKKHRGLNYPVNFNQIKHIILFQTKGYFYGDQCYALKSSYYDNGRRDVHLNQEKTLDIIDYASQYLNQMLKENGMFNYGYFSCFDKPIRWYNILRHASSVYSMLEAYELTQNKQLIVPIESALNYLKSTAITVYTPSNEDTYAYVIDYQNNKEIKLGANAAAILAFSKYTEVLKDERYLELAQALARGIKKMQQEDGSFVHILNYPDLQIKEKFRIIYYDGEATFALMRLYGLDHNEQWLNTVEKAFDYFLKNDYWKHQDHWLSYCTNELTKYKPEDHYFEFGLKNVFPRLEFIMNRKTTYPTFLELMVAAYELVIRMGHLNKKKLLESYDIDQLVRTIHYRADYQLNGYFYPEIAMYFKTPHHILNGFFIRHHSFRTRIDDVEHNISGYCRYLKILLLKEVGDGHGGTA